MEIIANVIVTVNLVLTEGRLTVNEAELIQAQEEKIASLEAECMKTYNQMMDVEKEFQRALAELQEKFDAMEDGANNAYLLYREYKDAEEQGLLIKLPCKVGDTVYEANTLRGLIAEYEVTGIIINKFGTSFLRWRLLQGIYSNLTGFDIAELGKTVFITREEADEALKGGASDE
jgi:hypothetical protein